jgi:protein SCO1/2
MLVMRVLSSCAALLIAGACTAAPEVRTYELTGQVLAVEAKNHELLVKHDDIPGFMMAMTMPYLVQDAALLKDRRPGDLIKATLTVGANGTAVLTAITGTGSAPLPEEAPSRIPAAANVQVLQPGDEVPPSPLLAADGRAIALTFIYTRCPLPQYCPLLDRRFAELQKLVADDPATRGRVRLLSVSFDPGHDSHEVLAAHAKTLGADPRVWTFATAPVETVDRFAAEFGVNVIREKDGTITHNLRTAIIDPSGRVVAIHDSNAWTAADLAAGLKRALGH